MKKIFFIALAVGMVIAAGVVMNLRLNSQNETAGIFLVNHEALSEENSDYNDGSTGGGGGNTGGGGGNTGGGTGCHYVNGYTKFSSQSGGAYDCCMIWRNLAPASDAILCK
jgi:hypothetical protein